MSNTIHIDDISFPIFEGQIGINFSGGADSSLLTYILFKELPQTQNIILFTMVSSEKGLASSVVATNVLHYLIRKTGRITFEHRLLYVDVQTPTNLSIRQRNMLETKEIEAYYTGVTANPPLHIADNFLNPTLNSTKYTRDPLVFRPIHNDKNIITPFTNKNKQWIYKQYVELNIMDMFSITRSCEEYTTVTKLTHCGECWWCKEREKKNFQDLKM